MGLLHKARIARNNLIYAIMEHHIVIEEGSHDDGPIEKDRDYP